MSNLPVQAAGWVKSNPAQTAMLIANTISMVIPGIVSDPLLWILGFGGKGPILGEISLSLSHFKSKVESFS
jgi:hypothetical protein